jgi:hypothetical protein
MAAEMNAQMLTGYGQPTRNTKGVKGQRYKDLNTGDIYVCELDHEYSPIHHYPIGGYIWTLRVDGNGDDHGANLNPDWSISNPNSGSYIQNRPFYSETHLDVVLPEATIPKKVAYLNDYTSYTRNLERNHEYTVICDGVEYKCVPVWNDIISSLTIGNPSLASLGDDTGETFFINSQMNMMMTAIYFATDGPHTISINEGNIETIVTLDEKFIPDTIARKGDAGGSKDPIVIFFNDEPMSASVTFEEAWALSVSELATRLCACGSHEDINIGSNFTVVKKNNTRTWGRHIVARFDYFDAVTDGETGGVVVEQPGYVLWAEGHDPQFVGELMP